MISLTILIIGVLLISALCSMSEAAILSLPRVKARVLLEQKRQGAGVLLYLKENIHGAVAAIVILNNAVNIIGAIFVGQRVAFLFGSRWLAIASAVLTFTIIVVSEIIPKTIGEHYKVGISLFIARPLLFLMWLFKPLVGAVILLTHPLKRKLGHPRVSEEEIKIMLNLGKDAGTIETDEATLCHRVFKLNDLRAKQMMRPIANIYAFPEGAKLAEVKDTIVNSPYSRIAVYREDKSRIVGICQQRLLLREIARENDGAEIKDFVARPIFVDENERADHLLEKFQAYHQHLFIVQDNRKQNIGILSMEDVLEELFGEIYDERDSAQAVKKEVGD